ncbi:MAG TPA: hypothetical protein VLA43_08160 [Longimicrobiales bacterium]|nr:hypothetical protein [Longimicrobiales bacterium]
MAERRSRWKERLGEEMPCARCGEVKDSTEMDRLLWCEACVAGARARAGRAGWTFGIGLAGALGLWVWLGVQPVTLPAGAWLAILVAAAWLGAKLGREVAFGIYRSRE